MMVIVVPEHYNGFTPSAIKKMWGIDCKIGDIVDLKMPLFDDGKPKQKNLKIIIKK